MPIYLLIFLFIFPALNDNTTTQFLINNDGDVDADVDDEYSTPLVYVCVNTWITLFNNT